MSKWIRPNGTNKFKFSLKRKTSAFQKLNSSKFKDLIIEVNFFAENQIKVDNRLFFSNENSCTLLLQPRAKQKTAKKVVSRLQSSTFTSVTETRFFCWDDMVMRQGCCNFLNDSLLLVLRDGKHIQVFERHLKVARELLMVQEL